MQHVALAVTHKVVPVASGGPALEARLDELAEQGFRVVAATASQVVMAR